MLMAILGYLIGALSQVLWSLLKGYPTIHPVYHCDDRFIGDPLYLQGIETSELEIGAEIAADITVNDLVGER
jgi:hypothetical protein